MDAIDQEMVRAIGENKQGTFTPETIEKLRKLQAKSLDARWEAKLEGLRRRAPFKDYPVLERNRALQRAATLSRRVSSSRRHPNPVVLDSPACIPEWKMLGNLGPGGFSFGSDPNVVPATDNNPSDDITGNSIVSMTYPQSGQIALGAAAGEWCDLVWNTKQTLIGMQGNRASASLFLAVFVPPNLGQVASHVLVVSCDVLIPSSPYIFLAGGYPQSPDGSGALAWVCGQATLDVLAGPILGTQSDSKTSRTVQELFLLSETANATSSHDGGEWALSQPLQLSTTMVEPPADSDLLLVTVSVEVSAWTLPATDSIAFIDSTGQGTGQPMLSWPEGLVGGNTAYQTQMIQVSNVQVCGT